MGVGIPGFVLGGLWKRKTRHMLWKQEEPGLVRLDHLRQRSSCSWGRKGSCGGGGWRKQLLLAELRMSQARNFHTATFSARLSSEQQGQAAGGFWETGNSTAAWDR